MIFAMEQRETAIVIGAGFGGLAAAIRLAAQGLAVTVVEAAEAPGGKARAFPSAAGPVDAGPTVLTLRQVFDDLFALAGQRLDDQIRLIPQTILARHWWQDSPTLDLFSDREANIEAIRTFAGPREAAAFAGFDRQAAALYAAFDAPVMQAARPDLPAIARAAAALPLIWPALLPGRSLAGLLASHFRDPRLVQLFGRYATYVGGRPGHSPAVLSLIWRAEAAGVWAVEGGMHGLAAALARLAEALGVRFRYATRARRIVSQGGCVSAVEVEGATLPTRICVFNGDPAALTLGLLGEAPAQAIPARATAPRSLSAHVWAFAACPHGADLVHHNVFFTEEPEAEFGPIGRGAMPEKPTLYICAEDRAAGPPAGPLERFEIILNAPAGDRSHPDEEARCRTLTFQRLKRFGLSFSPEPASSALITPALISRHFPGSEGAIYGRSPEGTLATFQRPTARTALPGLYLAGGGVHPGAGVPMAALSGKHAAEAIWQDRTSGSTLPRTAMPGGILTASAMTEPARSR